MYTTFEELTALMYTSVSVLTGLVRLNPCARTVRQGIKKCTYSAESLDVQEVRLVPFWTMFGALDPFKVGGLRPPPPPGTYTLAPGNDFF